MAHFDLPLNLPHAATIAGRIVRLLADTPCLEQAEELQEPLLFYQLTDDFSASEAAYRVRDGAARRGRQLVADIERLGLGHDRLGQCLRNLFECLELGEEGAALGLLAGENPDSLQRP